jgi:hypothetical protein
MFSKPVKTGLQKFADSKHTTISYVVNTAVEEYLKKYSENPIGYIS